MPSQIFKDSPPIKILFEFLEGVCEKVNNKYRFQIILKSSKKYDVNSSMLHFFVSQNFVKYNNKVPGSNKIHIHIDPVTMI